MSPSAPATVPESAVQAEDRLAILDLLGRYVFAVDTGDAQGVLDSFTDDGAVVYGSGDIFRGREELEAFARKAIGGAETLGRMHLNFPLFFDRKHDVVIVSSYLSTARWRPPSPPTSFGSLRFVRDYCVKTNSGWKICERRIDLFDSESVAGIAVSVRAERDRKER